MGFPIHQRLVAHVSRWVIVQEHVVHNIKHRYKKRKKESTCESRPNYLYRSAILIFGWFKGWARGHIQEELAWATQG
jgi:hypothetical protein